MRTLLPLSAVLAVLGLTLGGCFYSHEIAQTRRAIEKTYPEARLDREVVLNFGPGTLFLARLLVSFSGEEEDVRQMQTYLRHMRRIKVGVFRAEGLPASGGLDLPQVRRLRQRGWQTLVAARDESEVTWILYRERRGALRDLYVLALDQEELAMVRLSGHLDPIVLQALREHGPLDLDEGIVSGF